MLFPAIRWPSLGGVEQDTATITNYVADFTVAKDGRINVTETLQVNFPDYKHGIFRFFDVQDPNDSHVRLVPHDIAVSRDGRRRALRGPDEGKGRYRNVKIGSADTTMTGAHTYVITLQHRRRPRRDGEGRADFYWNLIGAAGGCRSRRPALTVHLPARFGDVKCAVGQGRRAAARPDPGDGFVVTPGRST